MAAVGLLAVLFAALAVAAPLVLYLLVRSERGGGEPVDRAAAERSARRDTDDG